MRKRNVVFTNNQKRTTTLPAIIQQRLLQKSRKMATTTEARQQQEPFTIPPLYTTLPPLHETSLPTETSSLHSETLTSCLPFLSGTEPTLLSSSTLNSHGIPHLLRKRHTGLLTKILAGSPLPPPFKAADPSRPWFFYWITSALDILGEDVEVYRSRLVETVRRMQGGVMNGLVDGGSGRSSGGATVYGVNAGEEEGEEGAGEKIDGEKGERVVEGIEVEPMYNEGGFAGGFGMLSHLATTYATVLALAVVGGQEAYDVIDRKGMWKWLCRLKQPDGGFRMAVGGEKDVRGAYCASVIISLLNIPQELTPDSPARAGGHTRLFDGLSQWVGRCQTYEGGISAVPGIEAHGAYAFCALGCLAVVESPLCFSKYLDIPRLISWLSSRQEAPAAGFSGRTNKLVDGCYSHWVGGCWPLIEASMRGPVSGESPSSSSSSSSPYAGRPSAATSTTTSDTRDTTLFSRNGLIRYILTCCQDLSKKGGLRDKPTAGSDAYHSCYVLAGLSSAQHKWDLKSVRAAPEEPDEWVVSPFVAGEQIFDEEDRVNPVHPVYVIRPEKASAIRAYFQSKLGF